MTRGQIALVVGSVVVGFVGLGAALYYRNHLPGGVGAGRSPRDVDPRELRTGLQIEREHTANKHVAREIAIDHLAEDPKYYTKLCTLWPSERGCKLL